MKLFVATKGLVMREGKMLIMREASTYIDGTELGKWDVPGGRIAPEEPFLDGLMREIKEECGLGVCDPRIVSVQETFPMIHGEQCHIVRLYFVVEGKEGEVLLSRDHDAYLWIDPQEHNAHHIMEDLHDVCETYLRQIMHISS